MSIKIEVEGKIVVQGHSNYLLLPAKLLKAIGKKKGDKIKIEIKE